MKVEVIREVEFRRDLLGDYMLIGAIFRIDGEEARNRIKLSEKIAKRLTKTEQERKLMRIKLDRLLSTYSDKFSDNCDFFIKVKLQKTNNDYIKALIKSETRKLKEVVEKMLEDIKQIITETEGLENWIIKDYKLSEIEL